MFLILGFLLFLWAGWANPAPDAAASRVHVFEVPLSMRAYKYETKWFDQKVDHYNFANDTTFKQKYLVNDAHWDKDNGPIFFYTGNEGRIEAFAENTGLMWDLAPKFSAMLVFAEHRYYGDSIPFGKDSGATKKGNPLNGWLSSEQALADYAELVTYLKNTVKGAKQSPVIAFGGSYGGMLAAWFRIKFPHICDGALAASAPVAQFAPTPCDAFNRIITSDFTSAGQSVNASCSDTIRKSWKALDNLAASAEGLKSIGEIFKLCQPVTKQEKVKDLKDYLNDVWGNLAMMDYPYETSFLKPLPGKPVTVACERLRDALKPPPKPKTTLKPSVDENNKNGSPATSTDAPDTETQSTATSSSSTVATTPTVAHSTTTEATTTEASTRSASTAKPDPLEDDKNVLKQVAAAAEVYYNYKNQSQCLNITDGDDIGASMWEYQACTEMVFPMCSDGINDMFEASVWNLTKYKEDCQREWKVTPRENNADIMYGQKKLAAASNIVFSNGLLDPWSSGGILRDVNKSVVSLLIPLGAHHFDLRGNTANDPREIRDARNLEAQRIQQWIKEARQRQKKEKKVFQNSGPSAEELAKIYATGDDS